jgi:hypothetical protein
MARLENRCRVFPPGHEIRKARNPWTDQDFRRFLAWLSPRIRSAPPGVYTERPRRLTRGFARTRLDEPLPARRTRPSTAPSARRRPWRPDTAADPAFLNVWAIARRDSCSEQAPLAAAALAGAPRRLPWRAALLRWSCPTRTRKRPPSSPSKPLARRAEAPNERRLILTYYGRTSGSGRCGRQTARSSRAGARLRRAADPAKRTQRIRERLRARLVALPGQAMGGGT